MPITVENPPSAQQIADALDEATHNCYMRYASTQKRCEPAELYIQSLHMWLLADGSKYSTDITWNFLWGYINGDDQRIVVEAVARYDARLSKTEQANVG